MTRKSERRPKPPSSLRLLRLRTGLSAQAAGELVGVSHTAITLWEHGARNPRPATIARLTEEYRKILVANRNLRR